MAIWLIVSNLNLVQSGGLAGAFASMPFVGTAPIVESGSNANGSWIKYADGTMICSAIVTANLSGYLVTAGDAIQKQWTFPVAFFNVPTVFSTLRTTNTAALWKMNSLAYQSGDGKSVATIAGTFSGYAYNSAHTAMFNAFALGRWKG